MKGNKLMKVSSFIQQNSIAGIVGVVGGAISNWFGGWNTSMSTLILFLAIDYITGIVVAAVFKKSTKTKSGALQSQAGFQGLMKKMGYLVLVIAAHRVDITIGITFFRDGVIIAIIANELISIVENLGLMGVPMFPVVQKAIDILKNKAEQTEGIKNDKSEKI